MAVIDLSWQQWNLRALMDLVKEASSINLSTSVQGEAEPLAVLTKLSTGEEKIELGFSLLKHVHYGFVIVCSDKAFDTWIQMDHLDKTLHWPENYSGSSLLIMSGTLDMWRLTLIEYLQRSKPTEVRKDLERIVEIFIDKGFGKILHDYAKRFDKALYLEKL